MVGMTVDVHAGETLTANRLNGRFQFRLCSLYIMVKLGINFTLPYEGKCIAPS